MSVLYPLLIILIIGAALSYYFKKLTLIAAIIGCITGYLVYAGSGYTGIAMMAAFFLIGTIATAWKAERKRQLKGEEGSKGPRNAWQVLANAGAAALIGIVALFHLNQNANSQLLISAVFAAALADTLASELGSIYGKRFVSILNLRKEAPGLDGVISLEGTLIGVGGSMMIAAIGMINLHRFCAFLAIVVCGTIGNLTDSILGAALERKGYVKNDMVNFLNTLVAALSMWIIITLFKI